MKIAFLGLGTMGAPMAANVATWAAGRDHTLAIWNRTPARRDAAIQQFAALQQPCVTRTDTIAGAVSGAGAVLSMLADPAALSSVLEGPGGAVSTMQPGATLIEMSTVDPATTRRIAAASQQRGLRFVDAPVIGSRRPAVEARLLILAAGTPEDVAGVEPLLSAMGRVLRAGGVSSGASLKLVANSLAAHMITGFASALVLGTKLGLEPETVLSAITQSAFSSPVYAHRGPMMLARDFDTVDFSLRLGEKDWRLAVETAAAAGMAMPTLSSCLSVIREAIAQGHGEQDLGAVIKPFEAQAGVIVRGTSKDQ